MAPRSDRRARRAHLPALSAALSGLWLLGALLGCSRDDDGEPRASDGSGTAGKSGGAGSSSGGSALTDARAFVDAHNAVRAAVQKPADYAGDWQSVPPVTWSEDIAETALDWAEHLASAKDCGLEHAMGSGYGENLAAGTNLDAEGAVAMWASERRDYSYSPKYVFEPDTGHYTQIVWRSTERIGCASVSCERRAVVVCRYDPPGNYLGQQIY